LLSIIVPARNSAADTSVCLASIGHSLASLQLACEIVLIDDASDPAEKLTELFLQHRAAAPQHQFIIARSRRHQHYTGVFSIGLHLARGDNAVFVSNDMVITPSFLTALLGVSALSADFGIVRGTSNYVDSHPEHTVNAPSEVRTYKDVESFSRQVLDRNGLAHTEDRELSGDAVLIKRSVLDRIGVMDQRFSAISAISITALAPTSRASGWFAPKGPGCSTRAPATSRRTSREPKPRSRAAWGWWRPPIRCSATNGIGRCRALTRSSSRAISWRSPAAMPTG
jgi:hypothetical protein